MRAVLLFLCFGLAAPAAAGKRAKKAHTDIVFVSDEGASKEIFAAVEGFCVQADSFYNVGVWKKKKIKKRVAKCADAACLVKLAKKKKLGALVVGRAHALEGGGVRFAFQTIDVDSSSVTAESELEVASVGEAQSQMARAYFGIVGITTPGYVVVANAPPSINVDGRVVEVKDGKVELPPGPHALRVNNEEQDVMVLPGESREVEFASLASAPPIAGASEPAATVAVAPVDEPAPAAEETVEVDSGAGFGSWTWIGAGTAAAGAVLLAVGGVFGTRVTVEPDPDVTQLATRRLNHDARTNATIANALFISGGVLALAGTTVAAFDLLGSETEPSVSVTVAPVADGGALVIGGRW